MYIAEICFPGAEAADPDRVSQSINGLLHAWRMNGQVCGREWPIAIRGRDGVAIVMIPDRDALDSVHANQSVQQAVAELCDAGLHEPTTAIVGEDIDGATLCTCTSVSSYILFTDYVSLESPLRCGECFGPVPLYKIPPTYNGEYYDLIGWQSDYQACDRLQMNCWTLERASVRELSRLDSSLSQHGLGICAKIADATGVPVYYYLYRYGARNKRQERTRPCPSCGCTWLLETPWHRFDFKCDRCRLLSNIAWNLR